MNYVLFPKRITGRLVMRKCVVEKVEECLNIFGWVVGGVESGGWMEECQKEGEPEKCVEGE